jgi:hypothetical protein
LDIRLNGVDGGTNATSTGIGSGADQGDRWSRVRIEHDLFDDDFLNAIDMPQVPGVDGNTALVVDGGAGGAGGSGGSGGNGGNGSNGTPGGVVGNSGHSGGGFSSNPISLWLADVDSGQIINHAHAQMSRAVSVQCRQGDRFTARLARQTHALTLVHRSMGAMWQQKNTHHPHRQTHKRPREATAPLPSSSSSSLPSSSSSLTPSAQAGMATLPPSAHLGLFMFHILLDCVNESPDLQGQQELLHSIVPMIHDLSAMSKLSQLHQLHHRASTSGTPSGTHAGQRHDGRT